jgi:hypothetical protein
MEYGAGQPIADVDVSLTLLPVEGPRVISVGTPRNIVQLAKTDSNGAFLFKLDQLGEYRVLVNKEGYRPSPASTGGASVAVRIDTAHPAREVAFELARPGAISGCVLDEDTKEPVPKIRIHVMPRRYSRGQALASFGGGTAFTDKEGCFVVRELEPANYVIRPGSRVYSAGEAEAFPGVREGGLERLAARFAEDDLKTVDWDYALSWWPGGTSDAGAANAVPLGSGGSINIGNIVVRKQPVYRVRLSVLAPTCGPRDVVDADLRVISGSSALMGSTVGQAPCGRDLLMRGFAPGAYRLELSVGGRNRAARERGSLVFSVVDKNIEISTPVSRGVDVQGKILLAEGAQKPPMEKIAPRLTPIGWVNFLGEESNPVDAGGKFRIVNTAVRDQRLFISGLEMPFYVKEVRYNGSLVSENVLSLDAHAVEHSLEIVVDDNPATVFGTARDGDEPANWPQVVLAKWPLSTLDPYSSLTTVTGDENGKFQFIGLPPGEYRLFSVPAGARERLQEPGILDQLMRKAEKITLAERAYRDISLEVHDPR